MVISSDTKKLLEKYGNAVPRYTSYPTAPHFKADFPLSYSSYLLASQTGDKPLSLYFHIPFCRQLCHYCGCFTKIINHDQPLEDYLRLLIKEIRLAGEITKHKPLVSHIHFGGGSPNMLSPEDLQNILDAVREGFSVVDSVEIAMEVDPRLLTKEKIEGYAAQGINRASLGVQDFQKDVQRAINRVQPYETVARSVEWLRGAGIKNINFDLIYGLPLQTLESIEDNVDKAVSLYPDRIALFGYAHVPWMKPHQKLLEKYPIPDMEERFAQQEKARDRIVQAGYQVIGMDHFALPEDPMSRAYNDKKLQRNFQGYTTDHSETIIGFGLSSISSYPQAYTQNTSDITIYRNKIREGLLPVAKGCILTEEDRLRREIIQSLMCHFYVDTDEICNKYGMKQSILKQSFEALTDLLEDGLVRRNDHRVEVTETGKPFVRVICSCFDSFLVNNENGERHAKAV